MLKLALVCFFTMFTINQATAQNPKELRLMCINQSPEAKHLGKQIIESKKYYMNHTDSRIWGVDGKKYEYSFTFSWQEGSRVKNDYAVKVTSTELDKNNKTVSGTTVSKTFFVNIMRPKAYLEPYRGYNLSNQDYMDYIERNTINLTGAKKYCFLFYPAMWE
jgi:hypothetical protein